MANKITFEIIAKALGFKNAEGGVKRLSGSMKKFAAGLVTTAVAYKAIGAAVEGVQLAGKLEGVERAFDNMRDAAGFSINTFKKLDDALDGTVDKLTVMEQANAAMLLGIADSDDQMAELFDTAQRLAQAVGQDATFGIESLVTGLGRQSKLMLDNLGIMVDTNNAYEEYAEELGTTASKLTEAERKQAFINKALSEGKRLVDGLGEETLTSSQKLEQFSTSITNLKTAIGEALITSGALDTWQKWSGIIIDGANALIEQNKAASETSKIEKELAVDFDNSIERQRRFKAALDSVSRAKELYAEVGDGESTSLMKVRHQLDGLTDAEESYLMELMNVTTWSEAREMIAEDLIDSSVRMNLEQRKLNMNLNDEATTQERIIKDSAELKQEKEEQIQLIKDEATALENAEAKKKLHADAELARIEATREMNEELKVVAQERVQAEQEKFDAMTESYSNWLVENFHSEQLRLEAERDAMLENVEQYENAAVHKAKIDDFYDKKKRKLIKAQATAQRIAFAEGVSSAFSSFAEIGKAFGANAEFVKNMTIAAAIADALAGANKAFAQGGVLGYVTAAGVLAAGYNNVAQIRQAYAQAEASKKESSQYGFEGVVDEPTQFTVGEGGAAEFVSVTPMEGVDNSGGGGGVNIQISGNVMTDEFVEEILAEKIADAVRRGTDFGIS